jgi:hypothetical protein
VQAADLLVAAAEPAHTARLNARKAWNLVGIEHVIDIVAV